MFCERGGWGGGGGGWGGGIFFNLLFPCTDIFLILRTTPPPPITWLFSSDLSLRYTELWQKRPNNQNILYCVLEPKVFNKSTQFKSSAIRTVNNFALLFLTVRSKQSRIRGALRSKIYFCRFVFSQAIFGLFFVFFFFLQISSVELMYCHLRSDWLAWTWMTVTAGNTDPPIFGHMNKPRGFARLFLKLLAIHAPFEF